MVCYANMAVTIRVVTSSSVVVKLTIQWMICFTCRTKITGCCIVIIEMVLSKYNLVRSTIVTCLRDGANMA